MPINTLIISETPSCQLLQQQLNTYCPQIQVVGILNNISDFLPSDYLECPELLFLDVSYSGDEKIQRLTSLSTPLPELVFVSDNKDYLLDGIQLSVAGYLLNPVSPESLVKTVYKVQKGLEKKAKIRQQQQLLQKLEALSNAQKRVGLPTMKGLEMVSIHTIIRCEGDQKCTRVVLNDGSTIISSHNIGKFYQLLKNYGFFPTHKSHLVNLIHVRRYEKDGVLTMSDDSTVPVSRRKKTAFLEKLTRL